MPIEGRVRVDHQSYKCSRIGKGVHIRSQFVYPVGILRGLHPRIVSRTCDQYADCRVTDRNNCPIAVNHFNPKQ